MAYKRLDEDIRSLAEAMQTRREEAKPRVASGEIAHLRRMDKTDIIDAMNRNFSHVVNGDVGECHIHLADLAVYGLALLAQEGAK